MDAERLPAVSELLPHRAPMVLLDALIAKDDIGARCAVTPRAGMPFAEAEGIQAVVALEFMAQTVGVFAGLEALASGEVVRPGVLMACSQLALEVAMLPLGERLEIAVQRVWGDKRVGQFECQVFRGDGRRCASATLSVAQVDPAELSS